jgi:hypothetical protein
MSFNLIVEGIIVSNIFTESKVIDWNEYKINILNNLNNINFNEKIENYISSGKTNELCSLVPSPTKAECKSLHVTKKRMRKILYDSIVLNNNIFIEIGYDSYSIKEQYNIKQRDVYIFIEECIKILVKKQQLK